MKRMLLETGMKVALSQTNLRRKRDMLCFVLASLDLDCLLGEDVEELVASPKDIEAKIFLDDVRLLLEVEENPRIPTINCVPRARETVLFPQSHGGQQIFSPWE